MPPFLIRCKLHLRGRWPPERRRRALKRKRKHGLQICHLPQDILEKILSCLPMKEAARTCLVSRNWRQAWASYPKITLNSETMLGITREKVDDADKVDADNYRAKFIENAQAVMGQHQVSGVEEFVLDFFLFQRDAHHINSWVSLAASMRLKRLVVNLGGAHPSGYTVMTEKYSFPLQLLDHRGGAAHLHSLQLTRLSLKPLGDDFRDFANLTVLELYSVDITEDDLHSLLCKCPALERLTICSRGPFMCLRIGHHLHRLEHLSLANTIVENLHIDAVNLKTISHGYRI